jgi:hypothetical protein
MLLHGELHALTVLSIILMCLILVFQLLWQQVAALLCMQRAVNKSLRLQLETYGKQLLLAVYKFAMQMVEQWLFMQTRLAV